MRKPCVDSGLNRLLILWLAAAGIVFVIYATSYGLLLALAGWAIALGIYLQMRWAYFAGAAWALACYQLAKEGLEFELVKRVVMISSVPLLVLSIYLHEIFGRRPTPRDDSPE